MVGGDDQQIVLAHLRLNLRQLRVKRFQRGGVALHIAAMAVDHIKIHEINKQQAVEILVHRLKRRLHAGRVARRMVAPGDAAMVEDVLNLAHAVNRLAVFGQNVAHRLGRLGAEIAARAGALERARVVADKRTRDDAAHLQLARQQLARNLAVAVQLFQRHNRLVRRDLEHAVRRGIDDQLAGFDVFLAQLVENRRAGGGLVAQRAAADRPLKFLDEILREAVRERRERLRELNARDFPVTGGRVLAGGNLAQLAEAALGRFHPAGEARAVDVRQPQLHHMRQVRVAGVDDMAERIRALVAVLRSVRQFADAHAVQNDDDRFFVHGVPPFAFPSKRKRVRYGHYTASGSFFQSPSRQSSGGTHIYCAIIPIISALVGLPRVGSIELPKKPYTRRTPYASITLSTA